jgi:lipopolysaccharide export system protein LptA
LPAASAHADKSDRDKPINLEADRVTVDDAKQIATFTGNVILTQGTMILRGDRMEVRQDKAGFKQGTTWGNLAYFRQKREGYDDFIEGWAERIEYDSRADKVQMFDR